MGHSGEVMFGSGQDFSRGEIVSRFASTSIIFLLCFGLLMSFSALSHLSKFARCIRFWIVFWCFFSIRDGRLILECGILQLRYVQQFHRKVKWAGLVRRLCIDIMVDHRRSVDLRRMWQRKSSVFLVI